MRPSTHRNMPGRRRGVALAVAVLVATALAPTPTARAARATDRSDPVRPPTTDRPIDLGPGLLPVPSPLPAGAPGELIAEAPFTSGGFPFAVEPHQVLFHSRDRRGADIAVSGIVLVPTGVPAPPGGRPVVAWAHGTTGLVDGCAPSLDNQAHGRLNTTDSYERIDQLLAAGAIVAASDYPGLGTPGLHPYLDGVGEGRSVLDSVRLARDSFGGTGPVVVEGFSQGSQAAIFAGQEWSRYAPDLDLRAVVGIGTPTRFGGAFAALDLPVVQSYISKILAGTIAGHPEFDRSEVLTASGEAVYQEYLGYDIPDGPCTGATFDPARDLRVDPMTLPAWREAIEADYPGRERVGVPVLMVQSAADEQALAFLADEVCRDLATNGTDVRMWRYQDESHVGSVAASSDDRATWILDRLAGRPLTDGVAFTGAVQPSVLAECPADAEPVDPEPDGPGGTSTTSTTAPVPTEVTPPAEPIPGQPSYAG